MRDRFDGEPGTFRNARPLRADDEWIVLPERNLKRPVPKRMPANRDRFFTIQPDRKPAPRASAPTPAKRKRWWQR